MPACSTSPSRRWVRGRPSPTCWPPTTASTPRPRPSATTASSGSSSSRSSTWSAERHVMTLVAGIDSSTQSCKVVIRDADTGRLVRSGSAPHPPGTEVEPERWWTALQQALAEAGGLDDVAAVSVGGQQHGMVCLDERGAVLRPALLWNDTRSAAAAADLVAE